MLLLSGGIYRADISGSLVQSGTLPYPFSLRELLALVRHMKRFPEDELEQVLRNGKAQNERHHKFLLIRRSA